MKQRAVCVNTSCKVTLGPWQGQVDRNVLLCADGILPRVPLPARRRPTLAGYLYCRVGKEQQRLLVSAGFILPSHKHVYYATASQLPRRRNIMTSEVTWSGWHATLIKAKFQVAENK